MSRRSFLRRAQNLVLTVAAVVGAICLVLLVLGPLAGVRPLVVRSGSMEPAYPTGSLALARTVDAHDVEPGEVVVVTRGDGRVMHRVVLAEQVDGSPVVQLQLKGDANATQDPQPDRATEVLRVFAHVPYVGRAVAWLSRPPGVFVLGAYLAACAWIVLRPEPPAPVGGRRRREDGEPAGDR